MLRQYIREAAEVSRRGTSPDSFLVMLRRYPGWVRSLGASPLERRHPWMTYAAIEFLDRVLTKDMRVFEWGAGGSTLFLAERVGKLVSVEHDAKWSDAVRKAMARTGHRGWSFRIQPPEPRAPGDPQPVPSDPSTYASSVSPHLADSFKRYAQTIDEYPDAEFDVVIVDGRGRISCVQHAIPKVRSGGYLLLDDVDREHYRWAREKMQALGWKSISLGGPGPCLPFFRRTMAWRRQ